MVGQKEDPHNFLLMHAMAPNVAGVIGSAVAAGVLWSVLTNKCSRLRDCQEKQSVTKKIDFMCTAFRDGFQSVYGARVQTPDFLPALEAARDAGISYFEAGGGARFQSLYFYCQEDAFDMMDAFARRPGRMPICRRSPAA